MAAHQAREHRTTAAERVTRGSPRSGGHRFGIGSASRGHAYARSDRFRLPDHRGLRLVTPLRHPTQKTAPAAPPDKVITVRVQGNPAADSGGDTGLAAGDGAVWTYRDDKWQLVKVDPHTHHVVA